MALGKILVVDDDKNICELLRLYLEKDSCCTIISRLSRRARPKPPAA